MEGNDVHSEEVEFLIRVLVGNSLPFVDADRFLQAQNCRWSLICFTVGAASVAEASIANSTSRDTVCGCSVEVLVEMLERSRDELSPLVDMAFSSKDRESVRLREIGELAMEDLERALKRFVFAMSTS